MNRCWGKDWLPERCRWWGQRWWRSIGWGEYERATEKHGLASEMPALGSPSRCLFAFSVWQVSASSFFRRHLTETVKMQIHTICCLITTTSCIPQPCCYGWLTSWARTQIWIPGCLRRRILRAYPFPTQLPSIMLCCGLTQMVTSYKKRNSDQN